MLIRAYLGNKTYIMDIIKTDDGYYRFIDHKYNLLTTGFKSEAMLIEYKDCIRFDKATIDIMIRRYHKRIRI